MHLCITVLCSLTMLISFNMASSLNIRYQKTSQPLLFRLLLSSNMAFWNYYNSRLRKEMVGEQPIYPQPSSNQWREAKHSSADSLQQVFGCKTIMRSLEENGPFKGGITGESPTHIISAWIYSLRWQATNRIRSVEDPLPLKNAIQTF